MSFKQNRLYFLIFASNRIKFCFAQTYGNILTRNALKLSQNNVIFVSASTFVTKTLSV